MFRSSGILIYEPKAKSIPTPGAWWLILDCCPDLARYYREMLARFAPWNKVMAPAWGCHISVVRGEEPPHKARWREGHGESVEFEYSPDLQTNGEYYWLPVRCDRLLEIRKRLGLGEPVVGLHITVARMV